MMMQIVLVQTSPTTGPPQGESSLLHDPQFWIATAVAVVAAGFLLRSLLPKLGMKISKGSSSKATLTVGGKAIKK